MNNSRRQTKRAEKRPQHHHQRINNYLVNITQHPLGEKKLKNEKKQKQKIKSPPDGDSTNNAQAKTQHAQKA